MDEITIVTERRGNHYAHRYEKGGIPINLELDDAVRTERYEVEHVMILHTKRELNEFSSTVNLGDN